MQKVAFIHRHTYDNSLFASLFLLQEQEPLAILYPNPQQSILALFFENHSNV